MQIDNSHLILIQRRQWISLNQCNVQTRTPPSGFSDEPFCYGIGTVGFLGTAWNACPIASLMPSFTGPLIPIN